MSKKTIPPLDRRYHFSISDGTRSESEKEGTTYLLLAELPDKIENWLQRFPGKVTNVTEVLSVAAVNDEYLEKSVAYKWSPNLKLVATEKISGKGRVSFGHVKREKTEIGLTYYGGILVGKIVRVIDVVASKNSPPIIMKQTAELELNERIPLDDTYTEEEVVLGYENSQRENRNLQLIIEEEMERMLDNNGYVFSDDGRSFEIYCSDCGNSPCVWSNNERAMQEYDAAENDKDTQPNQHRHGLYRQMALIINDGPCGVGNRLKLPQCVLVGVRNLFPDPQAVYTGHRDN